MGVEFLSIVIFTFALVLLGLGAFTWWMERGPRRVLGILMMLLALIIAGAYAFLASRFAIALFGRLIVTIDLPRLMSTAVLYTIGVMSGFALGGGVFLWISGRLIKLTGFERKLAVFVTLTLFIALVISLVAAQISH
jgi:hypothetical protein